MNTGPQLAPDSVLSQMSVLNWVVATLGALALTGLLLLMLVVILSRD